jgi:hypothetical protein
MTKPIVNEIEPPKLTDEEIVLFTQTEWLNSPKIDYNRIFNADRVFNILIKQGKLKIEPKEILEIIAIVKEDNLQKSSKLFGKEYSQFKRNTLDADFIDTQCKKLALAKYFEGFSG